MSSVLDGLGNSALMLGAGACLPAGANLSGIVNIATQKIGVLVVNDQIFISAKLANLRTRVVTLSSTSIITHFELLFSPEG
jgi:hypothetical protein